MTQELIRLEHSHKAQKHVRGARAARYGGTLALGEISSRVQHTNKLENSALTCELQSLRKEELKMRSKFNKSMTNVRLLRESIERPVSRGIVESDKCDRQKSPRRSLQPLLSISALCPEVRNRRPRSTAALRRALESNSQRIVKTEPETPKPRRSRGPVIIVYQ